MTYTQDHELQLALGDAAARQLANATKTVPQLLTISPRWFVRLLHWLPVEAGIYRLNKVRDASRVEVACSERDERELPETFVDYEETPREYFLSAVNTVLDVHTRVSDLYSSPHDQIHEQLRLTVATRSLRETAAFGREATRRGVPPATVSLFGSQFITWRGVPLIPSDKLAVNEQGKTNILLLRVGESRQGVVGLYQPNLPGQQGVGLSVRFMGISRKAISSYLVSLYCSLAVLTDDAAAVLENVDVNQYHIYDYD